MINSIKWDRQDRNLSLLSDSELLSNQEVARRRSRVSVVTVRRSVADAVIFLASSWASFITGEIPQVDSGLLVRGE
jgi:enoyl-[acyl-carrier-protein] reductase (NADH)